MLSDERIMEIAKAATVKGGKDAEHYVAPFIKAALEESEAELRKQYEARLASHLE